MTNYALCLIIYLMKLRKLLLPLTFLGLSPTAHAAGQHSGDTIPQTKKTTTYSPNKKTPAKTIQYNDTDKDIYNKLIKSYNKNPSKHNIQNVVQLMTIMENPLYMYESLCLSISDAQYLAKHISPTLQKKLNIADKEDIIFTAINKRTNEISDTVAFNFVATHSNLTKLKYPVEILTKALRVALSDTAKIGKSQTHINCISNFMNFAQQYQNNHEITKLYSSIFVATANMIRDYNNQKTHFQSINILTTLINNFNNHIISGSVIDKEIQIKQPQDYVIQEYKNISARVNLAMVYNRAYLCFVSRTHKSHPKQYNHKYTQQLFQNYVEAIEIQYLHRKQEATKEQLQRLETLIKKHPEIYLFEPYFCNIYLSTAEYNKILLFMTNVKIANDNKAHNVPKNILNIVNKCNKNADKQQEYISKHMINVPQISMALPSKMSLQQIRKSVLIPLNISNIVTAELEKQLDNLEIKIDAMEKIIKNNPIHSMQMQQNSK